MIIKKNYIVEINFDMNMDCDDIEVLNEVHEYLLQQELEAAALRAISHGATGGTGSIIVKEIVLDS